MAVPAAPQVWPSPPQPAGASPNFGRGGRQRRRRAPSVTGRRAPRFAPEVYLAREREAKEKSEYFNGEIVAMAGASRVHTQIVSNLVVELGMPLKKRPGSVYCSAMRIRVRQTNTYTYPDVVVTCGEEFFTDDHFDVLLNPIVLIEVLSNSTEAYDRGKKFTSYQRIPSLVEYVLVSQEPYQVEIFLRQSNNLWLYSEFTEPDDVIHLTSIDCQLKLEDIYLKVPKIEDEEAESSR